MVDAGWVRRSADTWRTSRWPLPKPSLVRQNAKLQDVQGRSYVRMSKENAVELGIHAQSSWWWYALPVPSKRMEGWGQPLSTGERVRFTSGHARRVRAIGWDIERNRAVGVISMS